jgi:hypothetical protein
MSVKDNIPFSATYICHTNFDRCLAVFIGSSAASTYFTRHAHTAAAAGRLHHSTHGSLRQAGWRLWRRAGHGSVIMVVATKWSVVQVARFIDLYGVW